MTSTAGLRAAALAGVALVALVIALAVSHNTKKANDIPEGTGAWYTGLAAPYTPSTTAKVGACGVKLYVKFGGKQVLTQVVDRGTCLPAASSTSRSRWPSCWVCRERRRSSGALPDRRYIAGGSTLCELPGFDVEPTPSTRELTSR